jgi:hypothetical protein
MKVDVSRVDHSVVLGLLQLLFVRVLPLAVDRLLRRHKLLLLGLCEGRILLRHNLLGLMTSIHVLRQLCLHDETSFALVVGARDQLLLLVIL